MTKLQTPRALGVLGVPSSAGSHYAGQEKAPSAWRHAGLLTRLRDSGFNVEDHGDLPERRCRPADKVAGVRDLERVIQVASETAVAVAAIREAGQSPIVLGGDCTITLGVLAGFGGSDAVGLLYLDGDVDLIDPETSESGVLDSMGMTHMLGGGIATLSHLGATPVMLQPDRVVLFGFDPNQLGMNQWTQLVSQNLCAMPAPAVRVDPVGQADEAISYLEARVDQILVHFDVDVLDTGRFPLANFPHFSGLTLDEVAVCLARFLRSPKFAGLIITEVNPDHDTDGVHLSALTDVVVNALSLTV
jgi:arginase